MIQDCTEDEIKSKLLVIYGMIGLRASHYPTGNEKKNLHDYIIIKYGKKTMSEFVLAFDLAINNELDLKPEDVKVYDQFTISYLASIMSAYKKWLLHQHVYISGIKKNTILIEDKKELTTQEKIDWINEWKDNKNINIELIPIIFYDFLSKTELLISKNAKNEYTKEACIKIKTQLINDAMSGDKESAKLLMEFENMENNGFYGFIKDRIVNKAKRMIVYDYFKLKKFSIKTP